MKPTMDLSGVKPSEWTGARLCGGILEPTGLECGSASSDPVGYYCPSADFEAVVHGSCDATQHAGWRRMLLAFVLGAICGLACVAAVGCSSAYYTDGESIAYGTDVQTQRRFAGKVQTPKGLTFEGTNERRTDDEGIDAQGNAFAKVLGAVLDRAVAGGVVKSDLALKLREMAMEEVRLRAQPKPAEKAGSR